MFQVSQLKPVVGSFPSLPPLPPQLTDDLELLVEPEQVLGTCPSSGSTHSKIDILIKWKGLPYYDASWEPFLLIQDQFPDFHHEDKVNLRPGSNDRPPIRFTKARCKGNRAPRGGVEGT